MSVKAQKTILKLNDMTKEGNIKWSIWRNEIKSISGLERLSGNAYNTKVNGKNLRIYKYESRYYYEEDQFEWLPNYRLEFIDQAGYTSWEFPRDDALEDLYESIQYRSSGASEFFDKFLSEN